VFREHILQAIKKNSITCISGGTGCGKSTMVPKFLLEAAKKEKERVKIMVTLPRRMAVKRLAHFVAGEGRCGETVGYKLGKGDHQCSKKTKLLFVTVGYCLQYFANNPRYLEKCTHLILDEVCAIVLLTSIQRVL
jgi:HrpA-like RNA helicase